MKTPLRLVTLAFTTAGLTAYGSDAAANWKDHCASCHGEIGKGDTKMGKKLSISDLTDAKIQATFTDEEAFNAMKQGLADEKGKTTMKAIEGLSVAEMKALVPFVRSLAKK